jgi:limonene-1,2-epoxide hydrolase
VIDAPDSVVQKFFACFPRSDVEELVGFFSADAVYIDGPPGVHRGVDAIKAEFQVTVAMVPSTTATIGSLAVSGQAVLVERVDTFEIGGKPIDMEVMGALEVNNDGRITRWRDYYDLPTLIQQVTIATAPPG